MKNLSNLLLLVFLLLQFSCQKADLLDNPVEKLSDQHSVTFREDISCRAIPELCKALRVAEQDRVFARVQNPSGGYWTVSVNKIFKNEPILIIKDNSGQGFMLTKTENLFLRSKNDLSIVPNQLKNLFGLPFEKIAEHTITNNEITNIFGGGSVSGTPFTNLTINPSTQDSENYLAEDLVALRLCDGVFSRNSDCLRSQFGYAFLKSINVGICSCRSTFFLCCTRYRLLC